MLRFRPTTTLALRIRYPQQTSRFADLHVRRTPALTPSIAARESSTMSEDASKEQKPLAIAQEGLKLAETNGVERPQRFREFELNDRVYIVTGGGRGLGLTLAEALVEAGAHVYCLDRLPEPADVFYEVKQRLASYFGGSLHYRRVDVSLAPEIDKVVTEISAERCRLDGLVAAAGVQRVVDAIDYPPEEISNMMNINFGGVYLSAVACARQMMKYKTAGSMVLVGSMSGLIANRGLRCSVYNSSKAAVIQLGRSLAMEWGQIIDGKPIRVNVLCPGNIMTPMVQQNFKDEPHLKAEWENGNMMGRLSEPHEYRGAVLFMLSDASSFMTGSHLVIDGGYTAW